MAAQPTLWCKKHGTGCSRHATTALGRLLSEPARTVLSGSPRPSDRGADPRKDKAMADRKTMTRQTLIGEKGIDLISRRCLQMGFLFHPRRVDHGIDGHID